MKIFLNLRWCLVILLVQSMHCPGQTFGESRFDSLWTGYFRLNSGGWTAGDATISIPLPDGRVIWLFGDSYTVAVNMANNTVPCLFQVRNCFMVQDSVNRSVFKTILDTTMTGVNMTTFKLRPSDTSLFWPGHGYMYNDTVYIFLERYKSSNLNFEGCYIAKLTYPDLHQIAILPVQQAGTQHIFGRSVVADTTGNWLYIYGNRVNWIIWEPVLARCNISSPMLPWEYYTGTGWSPDPGQAQKISNDPVCPGFTVFPKYNKYYLITQENGYLECGLGREIWSYESPYPWGPFTGKTLLYTEESKFNGAYLLTYNAQAHPWNIENDELLVSYNLNDKVDTLSPYICPSQCKHIWTDRMDVDTYRPKFIRVPMGLITSAGKGQQQMHQECLNIRILQHPVIKNSIFRLELTTYRSWTGQIRLTDLYGRVLLTDPLNLHPGKRHLDLTAPLHGGMYFLEFMGNPECGRVVKLVVE
jgi:hypothetical protein